jgi:hypothetical protein
MTAIRWFVAALCVACLTTSASAEGPFGKSKLGNWDLAVYTTDSNGAFSHCIGTAHYNGGIDFTVSVDAGWNWFLLLGHPDWRLSDGEQIPITLTFNNSRTFSVVGQGAYQYFIRIAMPADSDLINNFRMAYFMTARAKGAVLPFQLTTTSRLLPTLAKCVKDNLGRTKANLVGFVASQDFAGLKTPSQSPQEHSPETGSADLQLEAVQLATNFILASGLRNPKVLSRQDTPVSFANYGAAWKSEEAVGAVKIVPPDGGQTKGLDVAAAIAAGDAASCKGKFASGRVSELIDSEVVFRGFSSCEDSDGARSAQFFVVPRKAGGFVIFSVANFQTLTSEPGSASKTEDHLEGFQKAALTATQ